MLVGTYVGNPTLQTLSHTPILHSLTGVEKDRYHRGIYLQTHRDTSTQTGPSHPKRSIDP